ncbi:MAG TPA: glycyl-radical enzyme activating protein [Bacteroidetes bacterium]|nr:glycyl-radical enzyme activating protein [Bacteroidota bacterium]
MQTGCIFDIKRFAIHDGPGIRTTVFFKGCPLSCRWCHNPEGINANDEIIYRENRCIHCDDCISVCSLQAITNRDGGKIINTEICDLCGKCVDICPSTALEFVGTNMTVSEVMGEIEKDTAFFDESGGGVTFSGGDPLLQFDFLRKILEQCRERKIHTTLDLSGYCPYESLENIQNLVTLFLFDLKVYDEEIHRQYTGVSNRLILSNLKKITKNENHVIVRIPVIPGVNDTEKEIDNISRYLSSLSNLREVHLLRHHNLGVSKYEQLSMPKFKIECFPEGKSDLKRIRTEMEKHGFTIKIGG